MVAGERVFSCVRNCEAGGEGQAKGPSAFSSASALEMSA